MVLEVILDSGYIEVHAWVDVCEDEIIIQDLLYDGQQVRVDKMHPELERQIEDVAIDEYSAAYIKEHY